MQSQPSTTARVLVVDPQVERAAQWTRALEAAGAQVTRVADVAGALRAPLCSRAVIAWDLPDGTGLDLLGELLARDGRLRAVLLADQPDHAATRAAWHAGALDLCPSDESPAATTARLLADDGRQEHRATHQLFIEVDRVGEEQGLRELGALAMRSGFTPAARARLLTAAAEALANARAHAYPTGTGSIQLSTSLERGSLRVRVEDRGRGCDAATAELSSTAAALPGRTSPGGLARMRALCEGFQFESKPGRGTAVELVVRDHGAALDMGKGTDLSDHDYLTAAQSRRLLGALAAGGSADRLSLPPALAVLAGRLLACTSNDRRARRALWS